MKRFAAFLLTLLLVFALCSCGKKHVEEQTVPPAVEDQTGEQQPEVKPAPQPVKPEVKPDDTAEDETVTTAPVTPVVKPAEEVKPQGGTSGGGGHHGGGSTVKNLTITEEKTVKGGKYDTVTIAASVGNGTVTLDGVTIQNELIVQGGGSNSIKVKNSTVPTVVLDKDTGADAEAPRLELTGTQVGTVEVTKPAIVEATDAKSEVGTLSAKDDVTIKGEATKVQNVSVPNTAKENVKLTVNDAAVEKVDVNKAVTIETNAAMGKTPVKNVEAKANVTVAGAATNVGTVTSLAPVTLTVNNAKVNSVSAEAPVTIEAKDGASKINTVEAKAPVTVNGANTKIETITVPETVTTKPEITVNAGSVNTVTAKGEAKVSGNAANAIANVEAAASVEVASTAVAKVTVVSVKVSVTVNGDSTGTSTVEVAVEVATSGNETVAIKTNNNVTVTVSTTKEIAPTVAVDDAIIDHIHTWDAGTVQTAARCDTAGSMLYTCTSGSCNTTKTETIPALGHIYGTPVYTWDGTQCTAKHVCTRSNCPHEETETVTATKIVTQNKTCTLNELSTYTATFANSAFTTQTKTDVKTADKLGHSFTDYVSDNNATCTADGTKTAKCDRCDATNTVADTGSKLGHTYGTPTYTWSGDQCTAERDCTRTGCSHTETETVTAAKSVTQNKTCTLDELSTYTATFANSAFTTQTKTNVKTADKLGHQLTKTDAKAATCEEAGNNEYWVCSRCKKVFSDAQGVTETTVKDRTIAALEHDWAEAWNSDTAGHWHICRRQGCNATSTKENHVPGAEATETTAQTCTVCGYELAHATGHLCKNHLTAHAAKAATCTTAGNSAYWSCECGKYYSDAAAENQIDKNSWAIAAAGHKAEKQDGQAATCTADSWKDYYQCSVCQKLFSDADCENEITNLGAWKNGDGKRDALGHAYGTTPVWNWAEDHTSATATFTCTRDSSHTVSVTASNTDITHEDVTHYNAEGTRTYTATVVFGDKTYQNTATKPLSATPFKVGANTYATYEDALAAAKTAPKHIEDESFGFEYDLYPTIEIYGNCTVEGNLHLATGTSIDVKNGGSLTVGSLTLDESTMNGFWLDAGTLRLEKGSSFKLGKVQYTGEGGAFVMGDASSNIELAGCAPDMEDNDYVAVFNGNITQQNTFAMDSSYMFFNEQKSVLTVKGTLTNNAYVDNRGAILIDGGTLINKNTIDNESDIAKAMGVTGQINILSEGTLTNEGGNINGGIINKTASSAADITAMSNDESVSTILVSSSITVEEDLTVKHPLTVARGGSLTVNSGVTLTFAPTNTSYWVISNLAVEQGGTITVNGTIETVSTIDEHDFTKSINAQVAVIGGTFDAENGTVAEGSTIMFNSGTCNVPSGMKSVNVLRGLFGEEATEANLRDGLAQSVIQTVIVQDPVELKQSEALVIPAGKTLQIDSGAVDAYGCNVTNNGTIEINAGCSLVVEKGGKLTNNGTICAIGDGEINLGDYIYAEESKNCTSTYEQGANAANTARIVKVAAVFDASKLQTALSSYYDCIIPSSTAEENGEVTLENVTVNPDRTLVLKEYVNAGDKRYHNATYNLNGITFEEGAGMVIIGDPVINVTGALDYSRVHVNGNPAITAPGVVHNAEELMEALPNGGDIYLLPFAQKDKTLEVMEYEDGKVEDTYESQYRIGTNTDSSTYEISSNTNLVSLGGDEHLAVFFDGGFTVASDTTLRFDGLNVVAAADSTVNGRVKVCNGILVVQANSESGATLTNNGTIQIGSEEVWGQFAIFDESKPNKIVNNGTIKSYGELKFDRNPDRDLKQFEGDDPIEYATFRNLVCELRRDFGNLPHMTPIDFEKRNNFGVEDFALVYAYPDGGNEFFNADDPEHSDYDAIGAFSWLIKNEIVPPYDAQTNPKLNPWHYMTYNEVSELFNEFASKVLGTATDLGITGNGLADKNPCFGELHDALGGLRTATVTTEEAFMDALDAPYVEEIRVATDTTLHGCYYKDGERVASATEADDECRAVYLWGAGDDRNGERKIIVEPGVILKLAENVKMDIQPGVELWVDDGGRLIVSGNVNVFGELEPDENDESRITVDREHGGNISYFGDAYFFGERLLEVAGDYMGMENLNIPEGYDRIENWDGNKQVTCLVAYGLQPQEDNGHKWWDFGRTLSYGEMKTVLTNVYKKALATSSDLPGSVSVGDKEWPKENDILDNRSVEELLSRFALVLPKREDATDSFTVAKDNDQTISGKIFTKPVTIACKTVPSGNDNFGGDIYFSNCEFKEGVTVQLAADIGYNIRLDGCTGSFTATTTDMGAGGNVGFFGDLSNVTVNGLTISGTAGWQEKDYNINVRYDECGNNGGVKSYIPTVEVVNNRNVINDMTVSTSGSYSGKLRIGGNMDVSRVIMGTDSMLELCNEPGYANIALGSNRITVNDDCGGEYQFTGSGATICVPNRNMNANIEVNGIFLGNPHVFGDGNYAIFFPVGSDDEAGFTVTQNNEELEAEATYNGNNCELRGKDNENWITDPNEVHVTVTVGGCTVIYDPIMWKPVSNGEFVDLLKTVATNCDISGITPPQTHNDYLTYGNAKFILNYVWEQYPDKGTLEFREIIDDPNYWEEFKMWKNTERSPDKWTCDWFSAHNMADKLKGLLNPENEG